ncbi:MAG: hypothetical protein AAFR58_12465 [Cyanobacteria bacterium J06627_28]
MNLIAVLVVIALLIILASALIWWLGSSVQQRTAAQGTLPSGSTPSNRSISEAWTTAPRTITRGMNATFVLTVNSSQVSGFLPVSGRLYLFNVEPSANISIVSVTPSNSGQPNLGSTESDGTIAVTIVANSIPSTNNPEQLPTGALVALQVNAPSTARIVAEFTVQ